jgi:hypothetical protein
VLEFAQSRKSGEDKGEKGTAKSRLHGGIPTRQNIRSA